MATQLVLFQRELTQQGCIDYCRVGGEPIKRLTINNLRTVARTRIIGGSRFPGSKLIVDAMVLGCWEKRMEWRLVRVQPRPRSVSLGGMAGRDWLWGSPGRAHLCPTAIASPDVSLAIRCCSLLVQLQHTTDLATRDSTSNPRYRAKEIHSTRLLYPNLSESRAHRGPNFSTLRRAPTVAIMNRPGRTSRSRHTLSIQWAEEARETF